MKQFLKNFNWPVFFAWFVLLPLIAGLFCWALTSIADWILPPM